VPDEDVPDFLRYGLSTIDANVRVPVRFKTGELKFVLGRDLPEAIRKLDGSIVHPPELQKEDYDAKFRRRYGDDFFTVAFGAVSIACGLSAAVAAWFLLLHMIGQVADAVRGGKTD
jgi:hypothetical protein